MSAILNTLLSSVHQAIKISRPAFPSIPSLLMLCDIKNRSGLSAIGLGTSIVSKLPSIGIPNGVNADGSANLIVKFVMLMAQEFVSEIKSHGLTISVAAPGDMKMTGTLIPSPTGTTVEFINTTPVKILGGNV